MQSFMIMPGSASADDLLYHYTSEAGLQGIIKSDRIWATHIRFLNDYTEFRRAFTETYVEALIETFRASMRKDIDQTAATIIDGVLAKRNHASILKIIEDSEAKNDTFVCSFTSSMHDGFDPGDRLSQWRGYSHSSQGFSLGFDRELLEKQTAIDNPVVKASVVECIYEDTGPDVRFFQEMGRNAAFRFNNLWVSGEAVPDSYQTINPAATEDYKKANHYFLRALSKATAEFFTNAARIKHNGFREEREWRIVVQASNEALMRKGVTKIRKGPFGETPYIEVPLDLAKLDSSPLRRVVVGPGNNKDDIKHGVQQLLEAHSLRVKRDPAADIEEGIEVSSSTIPYRSA
jgi:hypothetical protein